MTQRSDSDPEKRRMKGQTEIKHEILEKYLHPWLIKITEVSSEVRYIDGFAGWGRYEDGAPGSPLIAMNVAKEMINEDYGRIASKLDDLSCTFIEANSENFEDLVRVVSEYQGDCPRQIESECRKETFQDFAEEFIQEGDKDRLPAFIFVDPFGFSGLPFDVVNRLLNLRSTGIEMFITFVGGEMARFLESQSHAKAITEILGTEKWRKKVSPDFSKEENVGVLLQIYEEQLRSVAGVEYVWPFRMSREAKDETVYHLVHATNHFDGFKIMKDIMFNAGAGDKFAYLGPEHYPYLNEQQSLSEFDPEDERQTDRRIEKLANILHDRFAGRCVSFWDVMEETYQETSLIEKHYRKACKLIDNQSRGEIINHPKRPNGTKQGLHYDDEIMFRRTKSIADF